jgi:hypothetical protein
VFLYRQSYCDKDVPRPPKEGRAGRDIFTQVAYATLNGSAVNTLKYPPCCKLRPRNRLNPLVLCVCVCVCVCVCMVWCLCVRVCACVWCLCVCACMHVMMCSWEVDRVADRQVCMLAVYSQMYVCMYVDE